MDSLWTHSAVSACRAVQALPLIGMELETNSDSNTSSLTISNITALYSINEKILQYYTALLNLLL